MFIMPKIRLANSKRELLVESIDERMKSVDYETLSSDEKNNYDALRGVRFLLSSMIKGSAIMAGPEEMVQYLSYKKIMDQDIFTLYIKAMKGDNFTFNEYIMAVREMKEPEVMAIPGDDFLVVGVGINCTEYYYTTDAELETHKEGSNKPIDELKPDIIPEHILKGLGPFNILDTKKVDEKILAGIKEQETKIKTILSNYLDEGLITKKEYLIYIKSMDCFIE